MYLFQKYKSSKIFTAIMVLVLGILVWLSAGGVLLAQGVEFSVSLDKSSYAFGEDIWIEFRVANQGSDTLDQPNLRLAYHQIYADILDELGNKAQYVGMLICGGISTPAKTVSPKLAPGEEIRGLDNLQDGFGTPQDMIGFFQAISPGTYKLVCRLAVAHPNIMSDTLTFTVRKPEGVEAEMWEYIKPSLILAPSGAPLLRKVAIYKSFLDKYPDSFLGPFITHLLTFLDQSRPGEYGLELLQRYPNSPRCDDALMDVCAHIDRARLSRFLEGIRDGEEDTRLARIIRGVKRGKADVAVYSYSLDMLRRETDLGN